jgi:hypothetical protein
MFPGYKQMNKLLAQNSQRFLFLVLLLLLPFRFGHGLEELLLFLVGLDLNEIRKELRGHHRNLIGHQTSILAIQIAVFLASRAYKRSINSPLPINFKALNFITLKLLTLALYDSKLMLLKAFKYLKCCKMQELILRKKILTI